MAITVKPVTSKVEMKQFIYLPRKIHAHHANWVPPLWSDDARVLDPKRNPAHEYCDSIYALAYKDGEAVGRVTGVINHRYNEHAKVQNARFGFLEVPDDPAVTKALLEFVENWAKSKGMSKIVGPMGFTEEDPEAFIIEGYDQIPNLATYQNLPYLLHHLDAFGYQKEIDYMVYKMDIAGAMTDLYRRIFERVSRNKEFQLIEFKSKAHLKRYMHRIFDLMNASFLHLYGYSPLSPSEVESLAKRYMPLLDPRFIKVVVNTKDEVIGFIVAIPNLADGIRKAKGQILPFGIFHIMAAAKRSIKLDTYLGAIAENYRGKGVDALMGWSLLRSARDAGFKYLDSHHEMETNTQMRSEMERNGGVIYKKYRIFQKEL